MKRLKAFSLAFVAIAAMSFTVVSNGKLFQNNTDKKAPLIADCYGTLDYSIPASNPALPCAGQTTITINQTDCSTAEAAENRPLFTSPALNTDPQCGTSGSKFCCATLTTTTKLCSSHPQTTPAGKSTGFYKISEIFCKTP